MGGVRLAPRDARSAPNPLGTVGHVVHQHVLAKGSWARVESPAVVDARQPGDEVLKIVAGLLHVRVDEDALLGAAPRFPQGLLDGAISRRIGEERAAPLDVGGGLAVGDH